jgi:hypothetical protein
MDIDSIRELLENGESETVEAKSNSNDIASLEMTACAFANTKGGHIIIGVVERHNPPTERDRFRYDGIAAPRGLVRQLESIGKTFQPSIKVEVDQVRVGNNQTIFVVSIPKNNGTELVSLKNGVSYRRMGAATAKATDADITTASSNPKTSDEGNTQVPSVEKPEAGTLEEELFVDNSKEAAQLREKILQEFENLTEELQLSFARTQLGPGPIQSQWKLDFRDRLIHSNAAFLNRISLLLSEFSARGGRYIGDHSEYRRDANELEECLNLSKYVEVLARFFASTRDDVCFGLFGHWGRGKTHLMRRVGEQLAIDHKYQVVRFSAWKYRTNPELWIHLYQSMARAMRSGDFFVRLFVPFRAGLSQHGVWPIVVALFFQAIALVPMKEKYWFAQFCLQLLGTVGIFYVFFFYLHVKRLGLRLSTYLQVADHSQKLGLQATIGDDLKALLMGWLPKFQWIPSPFLKASSWKSTIAKISWLGLFCYLGLATWIFLLLSPEEIGKTHLPIIGQVDTSIPVWLIPIIRYIWLVFAFVFPAAALLLARGPTRILLVVDDLDRCPHEQILEIIESIMLLLDDDEIQRRLQVAVLVEEEAVHHAISEKYRYLWHDSANSGSDDIRSRVIQENLEKLFLVHLRLGPLNTAEIVEVADRYTRDGRQRPSDVGTVLEKTKQQNSELSFARNSNSDAEFASPAPNVPKVDSRVVQKQTQEPLKLTELEMDVLLSELQSHRITRRTRWGPRSIRCLINKYLLARELLLEIHRDNMSDPRELAQALLSPDDDAKELEQKPPRFIELTEYKGVKYIARQVR